MILSRIPSLAVALILSGSVLPAQTAFQVTPIPANVNYTTYNVHAWDAADVNGDGVLDFLVMSQYGGGWPPSVLLRSNAGGYAVVQNPLPGVPVATGARLIDMDGSGARDAVVVAAGGLAVLLGNGTGGFSATASFGPGGTIAAVADFTGDGLPDLLLDSWTGWSVVQRNAAGALVTWAGPVAPYAYQSRYAAADLDGDGDQDVLRLAAGVITRHDNTGTGFAAGVPVNAFLPAEIALGDVDGDGDADLVTIDGFNASFAGVSWNDGAGNFTPGPFTFLNDVAWGFPRATLADLDGDGRDDLVFMRAPIVQWHAPQPVFAVLHAYGTPAGFTPPHRLLPATPFAGGYQDSLRVLDGDADGDQDIVVPATTGAMDVLRNLRAGPHAGASGAFFGGSVTTGGWIASPWLTNPLAVRPVLAVSGALSAGGTGTVVVTGAPASGSGYVLIGLAPAQLASPWGCILAVAPASAVALPHAGPNGPISLGLPAGPTWSGVRFFLQDVFPSPQAPGGIDGTNGLMVVLP